MLKLIDLKILFPDCSVASKFDLSIADFLKKEK